jgi:tight adherence protein B
MGDGSDDGGLVAARMLDRVAALAAAGIPAARAWSIAAERAPGVAGDASTGDVAPSSPVVGSPVIELLRRTASVHPAGPWHDIAALWAVAERTGAPAVVTLRSVAAAVREAAAAKRAVGVALAGPTASGRIVLGLPVLGLLLGALVGADTLGVLLGSPVGWGCLTVGGGLIALARAWTARLVRAATPDPRLPGVLAEAWAVALSGGGSWLDAEHAVTEAFPDRATPAREQEQLTETLELARAAGIPAAGLLRALAEDLRREAAAEGLAAAERLAVRLVLPLGVCVLPAFVVVGIVPVVVGILSSTIDGLR